MPLTTVVQVPNSDESARFAPRAGMDEYPPWVRREWTDYDLMTAHTQYRRHGVRDLKTVSMESEYQRRARETRKRLAWERQHRLDGARRSA